MTRRATERSATDKASSDSRNRAPATRTANVIRPIFARKPVFPPKTRPRVVLLQGPVGPFFSELQRLLNRSGFDCWRVAFNAGDRLYAGRSKVVAYTGTLADWEAWFAGFLTAAAPDRIVLFGSERQIHTTARKLAKARGIPVVSLEEGYIRPGFITAEAGGNNRHSPVARQIPPGDFNAPKEADPEGFDGFGRMCLYGTAYYVTRTLFTGYAARKLFHRSINPPRDIFCWGRNLARHLLGADRDARTVDRLIARHEGSYYLVALQVAVDNQLRHAALGWSNARLIMETIRSFASAAPQGRRLVFKVHPLERGHSNDRALITVMSRMLGIAHLVDVVETGPMGPLTRHAAGIITINSTSGLSAIHHGRPLLIVGDAFYAHPALAICAMGKPDFDAFWTSTHVPDPALRQRYLAWVRHKCLKPGDFYAPEGRKVAAEAVRAMLGDVNSGVQPSRSGGAIKRTA